MKLSILLFTLSFPFFWNAGSLDKEMETCVKTLKAIYQKSNGITLSSDYSLGNVEAEYENGYGVTFTILYINGHRKEEFGTYPRQTGIIKNIDAFSNDAHSNAKYFLLMHAKTLQSLADEENVYVKLRKNPLAVFNLEKNTSGELKPRDPPSGPIIQYGIKMKDVRNLQENKISKEEAYRRIQKIVLD